MLGDCVSLAVVVVVRRELLLKNPMFELGVITIDVIRLINKIDVNPVVNPCRKMMSSQNSAMIGWST